MVNSLSRQSDNVIYRYITVKLIRWMKKKNMVEILKKEESETLGCKSSLSDLDDILATISAFSNTKGRTIFIGVDDGDVVGISIGRRTLEELSNNIAQSIDPKVFS
ncbi:MAG: helix-turn-helix domain-containing protein [Thermoprotei archaeon]|jgi:predicted HTH transcriptional regulator